MDLEDVLNHLVEHKSPNLPPGLLAQQFPSTAWIVDPTSQGQTFEVGRRWLRSGDEYRAAVALGMGAAFVAESGPTCWRWWRCCSNGNRCLFPPWTRG